MNNWWSDPTFCSVRSLAFTPRLHFYEAERGRGWDIQMSRSDSSSFPQCSACLKLHWLLLSQLLTSQRCALKTSDARGSRRMPHCLYEGTLTDLSGVFFPVRGLWREDFFYCHLLMSARAADYWVDCLLFLVSCYPTPCALFYLPFWNRRPIPRSPMSYPQGYLYQPPGSLALYSCPAYGASALAAPRNEDLARSSSGSAFSPYPGSAAFSASAGAGFSSPLSYSADPTGGFPSYMVRNVAKY